MKKVLALILIILVLAALSSCGADKKEKLLEDLEGKWVGYDGGFLYYATFKRSEEDGNMFYGSVRDMTKYGGTMTELDKEDKNVWKFKVENKAVSIDTSDIENNFIKLSNLAKDGKVIIFEKYTFDDNDWAHVREMSVSGPLTFYVTFDSDGGNEIGTMTVTEGDKLTDLPVPRKTGYEFLCWKDTKGLDYTNNVQIVKDDVALKAEYKDGRTINLDTRGGEVLEGIYVKHGDPLPELPKPRKANCIFSRWTDADKNTVEEGTVLPPEIDTLYAWYYGAVTLLFDSDGGGEFREMIVREGIEITGLPVPYKRGYIFLCWKDYNGTPILDGAKLTQGVVQLKAEYEKMTSFSVSFESNGGSGCSPIVVKDGDPLPALPVPSKQGYRFICWKDKNETPISEGALLFCENITLYAYYEEIPRFTVTFDPNGGSACSPITLYEGDALPALPKPTKEGYDFVCWKDKNDTPIYEGAKLTCEDITLYADYVKVFTVSFDSKGGTACDPISLHDGDKLPKLPRPTRSGYVFRSWTDKNGKYIAEGALLTAEDITLYANWIKTFKVTFDSNAGSSCSSITVRDGDLLPALPVPTRSGYKFVCWKDKNEMPIYEGAKLSCEDITLYAYWIKLFTVSFDSNGGSACSAITVQDGDVLPALPKPSKTGYEFICWKDKNEVPIYEGAKLTAEDITLYAYYRKLFTVTFDSQGGSSCSPIVVRDGDALPALPKPSRSGYEFICWRDKNETPIYEGANLAANDITLYAYWKKTTFTVTFDSDGGSACSPITVKDSDTLPDLPTPTKSGYYFLGWYDKNDIPIGTGTLLTCEDITLYAHYAEGNG